MSEQAIQAFLAVDDEWDHLLGTIQIYCIMDGSSAVMVAADVQEDTSILEALHE